VVKQQHYYAITLAESNTIVSSDGKAPLEELPNNNKPKMADTTTSTTTTTITVQELISNLLSISSPHLLFSPSINTNDDTTNPNDGCITVAEERALRTQQLQICSELLDIVTSSSLSGKKKKKKQSNQMGNETSSDDEYSSSFIRTNIMNDDNDDINMYDEGTTTTHLRDIVGGMSTETTAKLATVLSELIGHRVETLDVGNNPLVAASSSPQLEEPSNNDEEATPHNNDDDDDDEEYTRGGGTNMTLRSGKSTIQLHQERMAQSAKAIQTISKLSIIASQLYVSLIGMKGSWGAGMIDVSGITSVGSLVRRWGVECRGREGLLLLSQGNNNSSNRMKKRSGDRPPPMKRVKKMETMMKKKSSSSSSSNGNVVVVHPSRKSVRISEIVSIMNHEDYEDEEEEDTVVGDDGEEDNNIDDDDDEEEEDDGENYNKLEEHDMVMGGVQLANALGRAPAQLEYKNWSSEAREFYSEAACCALGIVSALLAGCSSSSSSNNKTRRENEDAKLCQEAVSSLELALRMMLIPPKKRMNPFGNRDSLDDATTDARRSSRSSSRGSRRGRNSSSRSSREEAQATKQLQESTTFLLRGILPMLHLKMELPNGQVGKMAAYEVVSSLLVNCISSISEDIELTTSQSKSVRLSTSSARMSLSHTPKAGGGGGRKSISFAHTPGKNGENSSPDTNNKSSGVLLPPSLKKSVTPRRATRSSTSSSFSDRPTLHPVLTLIMGLLQKLFTSKGLERAEIRSRVCSFGIQCSEQLPPLERSNILRFIGDMCVSKISSHRLLAVELIGEILTTGWFWKDHEKTSQLAAWMFTPFSTFGEKASNDHDNAEPNTPSSILLSALQGRLTDKSPTVRARAAMSLSQVVKKASLAQEENRNLDGTIIAYTPSKLNEDSSKVPSRALTDGLCKIGTSLVETLRKRASTDEKATVRKACIVAWLQMLSLAHRENKEEFIVSGLDISALCQLCNDSSVATRKAAADALTKLVKANYENEEYTSQASSLELAWAHTVLPLVSDAEITCVTKAVEFFSELVLDPIMELGRDAADKLTDDGSTRYFVALRILSKLSEGSKEAGGSRNGTGSLQTALQKSFVIAGSNCKSLVKNLLRAVYHVGAISLGLDRRSSLDSTLSHDEYLESDLFQMNIASMRAGAWCLLDGLTSTLIQSNDRKSSLANVSLSQAVRSSQVDSSFLTLSLQKLRSLTNSDDVPADKKPSLTSTSRACLMVIARMGNFVPLHDAETCYNDILKDLESFTMPVELISAAVGALVTLTKRFLEESETEVYDECEKWATRLLAHCEQTIESCFSSIAKRGSITKNDEKLLSRTLYFVGELSMVGFSSQEDSSRFNTKKNKDISPTDKEPVRGLFIQPSKRLIHLVKLMLPSSMPLPNTSDNALTPTPSSVRAHAFVALGKFCLRNETLAKENLNILARELDQDSTGSNYADPAVMNNCLMVLGDIVVRFTNLADKYLVFMAGCLQAGEKKLIDVNSRSHLSITFGRTLEYSMVKKNAILLLSSLLLQDYIKWRGLFVHRFLAAVADEDDEVSCLAQTALRGPLLEKQPNLLSNSFVGAVFVFNNCKAHPLYIAEASAGGNGMGIDFEGAFLDGADRYHKRREIYEMMLTTMSDEQKLEVTARLVKEVLGGALETSGDLAAACKLPPSSRLVNKRIDSATNVLTDTLDILTSPEIKVGRVGSDDDQDDVASTNGSKPDQRNLHKQRLLSKISRKHLMEIVIPILCNLKAVLEASHSPLLKNLMHYLGYIFRTFKAEVSEHLANNPTLLQELEYDCKRHRRKKDSSSILGVSIDGGKRRVSMQ
jgi:condensin-2 complex subunit D3